MERKVIFAIDEFYHAYNRGTDKRKIFLENKDYQRFMALLYVCNNTEIIHLSDYSKRTFESFFEIKRSEQLVDIGAYCLMPNHFHLLLRERKEGGISIFMKKLLTAYSMYFNKKHKRAGALFQGRFQATHADKNEYLKYLFSYIHLNPVKLIDKDWKNKGISNLRKTEELLDKYLYSSYLDYASSDDRKISRILNKSAFPDYFENNKNFLKEIGDWLNYTPTVKDRP